jgi:hypothetical protein
MRWIRAFLPLRVLVLILWISFVWYGYARLKIVEPSCLRAGDKVGMLHGIAKRAMPLNWRIGPGDVDWREQKEHPEFDGRYTVCKLAPGEPVVTSDVTDDPVIIPADGKMIYLLRLNQLSRPPQNMNAGMYMEVFGSAGAPVADNARVLAVVCKDSCSLFIEVTATESQQLQKENLANIVLLLRR